jgi:hypothetical protein
MKKPLGNTNFWMFFFTILLKTIRDFQRGTSEIKKDRLEFVFSDVVPERIYFDENPLKSSDLEVFEPRVVCPFMCPIKKGFSRYLLKPLSIWLPRLDLNQ